MRFLHTSDWHLGMTFRGGVSYRRDQKYMIEHICRIAVDEFEHAADDQETIFGRYCEDILEEAPSEHLCALYECGL